MIAIEKADSEIMVLWEERSTLEMKVHFLMSCVWSLEKEVRSLVTVVCSLEARALEMKLIHELQVKWKSVIWRKLQVFLWRNSSLMRVICQPLN